VSERRSKFVKELSALFALTPRHAKLSPMTIVRAKAADAERLTAIAHAAKRHWGYPENWIAAWRDILTMRPEFIAENTAYYAVEGGRAVGFYVLTREDDGLHLDHLWIVPGAMGRGIGRALVEHAAAEASRLGFKQIKIEADPNAEGFYKRMGATRVGTSAGETCGERRELPLMEFHIPVEAGRTKAGNAP
jgi:GNAT superfamily N-acetyltransferase